jgi:transposase
MHWTTLGIDEAKNVFQLHGVDERGQVVLQQRVGRSKRRETIAQLPVCVIGMEVCGRVQSWARALQRYGHIVRLWRKVYELYNIVNWARQKNTLIVDNK